MKTTSKATTTNIAVQRRCRSIDLRSQRIEWAREFQATTSIVFASPQIDRGPISWLYWRFPTCSSPSSPLPHRCSPLSWGFSHCGGVQFLSTTIRSQNSSHWCLIGTTSRRPDDTDAYENVLERPVGSFWCGCERSPPFAYFFLEKKNSHPIWVYPTNPPDFFIQHFIRMYTCLSSPEDVPKHRVR